MKKVHFVWLVSLLVALAKVRGKIECRISVIWLFPVLDGKCGKMRDFLPFIAYASPCWERREKEGRRGNFFGNFFSWKYIVPACSTAIFSWKKYHTSRQAFLPLAELDCVLCNGKQAWESGKGGEFLEICILPGKGRLGLSCFCFLLLQLKKASLEMFQGSNMWKRKKGKYSHWLS